jgi:hypothetical protein
MASPEIARTSTTPAALRAAEWGHHHSEAKVKDAIERKVPDAKSAAHAALGTAEHAATQHAVDIIARIQILSTILKIVGIAKT